MSLTRGAFGLLAAALAVLVTGCPAEPAFPEDFRQSFQEVAPCRESADHALMYVVVWAGPKAAPAYDGGEVPLPEGATVVKEEFQDSRCENLQGYSVMKKDPALEGADGWHYQALDAKRQVTDQGAPLRCVSCHRICGGETDRLCAMLE